MRLLRQTYQGLVRMIFPRPCPGCERSLFAHEKVICQVCQLQLPFVTIGQKEDSLLVQRLAGRVRLETGVAMLRFYKGGLSRKLLHAIKYKGHRELAVALGRLFGERLKEKDLLPAGGILVPVPLHPLKQQIRGFNQSEEIAKGIAEVTGYPVVTIALSRTVFHLSQTQKGREDRWEEIKQDFQALSSQVKGRDIILVDDVCTTGATIEACANTLLEQGAKSISLLTLAVAGDNYQ